MATDSELRTTFNREAELYHAIRPRYPDVLIDSLVRNAHLRDGAQLLEIGPGTGQATEAVAKRGYDIVAVELGADIARVAREALGKYPNVRIINAPFETVELPSEQFDLIYVATAFHWIESEVRFSKPHQLLRAGGHLAIISTHHVSDEAGDAFYVASQPIHKQHNPDGAYDDKQVLSRLIDIKADDVDEDLFTLSYFNAFSLVVRYSAEAFAQLLQTYSPNIAMEPDRRESFLAAIVHLIEDAFDGSIQKHYAMSLTIAQKK